MNRLDQLQGAFQRFLLSGDPAIEADVIGTARVPIQTRLGIYGNGYRARLIEALQITYPALAGLLETDFETLGARYVAAHPSTCFSVRYYGHALADFLAADADYASVPLLAELARWEWAMACVFDAADATPIDAAAFAGIPPESWSDLRLGFSPAVELLELEWNVPAIWKAFTEEQERPEPSVSAGLQSWLAWRCGLQIYFRSTTQDEAAALRACRAHRTFGELCLLLCEHLQEQEAAMRAAGFLRGWVESGLIVSLHTAS
ncbi:MAG TPA: DNA-binding domain-containing protein [Steroidobacteraceae bacterium]